MLDKDLVKQDLDVIFEFHKEGEATVGCLDEDAINYASYSIR